MKTFSRGCFFFSLPLFFSFLFVSVVLITTRAEASDAGEALFNGIASSLNVTVSKQVEQKKNVNVEPQKVYSEEAASTPHVRLSLSDTMKLFFNVQPTSKDYYDTRNNVNKACTVLGFDILF